MFLNGGKAADSSYKLLWCDKYAALVRRALKKRNRNVDTDIVDRLVLSVLAPAKRFHSIPSSQ